MKTINTLPPFKRLCVTIGNLPSSYVDSMSYYECLMWLCKYLKDTVIPAVNNNAQAVEELQNLFVQLQNYVNNYFDNLDIQQEIDNKIDEMVASGEFEELLTKLYGDLKTELTNRINEVDVELSSEIEEVDTRLSTNLNSEVLTRTNADVTLQNQINSLASGAPSGVYATASALSSADPDHSKVYVVLEDGKWYYYNTGTSTWTAGGTYQATSLTTDKSLLVENSPADALYTGGNIRNIATCFSNTFNPLNFVNGSLDGSGQPITAIYRIISSCIIYYPVDVIVSVPATYQAGINRYQADGTWIAWDGWKTGATTFKIPANTYVRYIIRKQSEDTSTTLDVATTIALFSFKTANKDTEDKLNLEYQTYFKNNFLRSCFVNGGINDAGGIIGTYYRFCTKEIMCFDNDVYIDIPNMFRMGVHTYTNTGSFVADLGWQRGLYKIPAGTYFRLLVARYVDDQSETLDIDTTLALFQLRRKDEYENNEEIEMLNELNYNKITVSNYITGDFDNVGVYQQHLYRVVSKYLQSYPVDVVYTIPANYRLGINYYQSDGTWSSWSGWITGQVSIPKNTYFKLLFAKVSEVVSETLLPSDIVPLYSIAEKVPNEYVINNEDIYKVTSRQGQVNNYPENTLIAYKEAKKYGYNHVRISFGWTSDDIAICQHEVYLASSTLRNSDGTAITDDTLRFDNLTYSQIEEYDAGIYKGSQFAGTKVPTVESALYQCKKLHQKVDLEFKFGYTEQRMADLLELIWTIGLQNDTIISTGGTNIIEYINASDYKLPCAYIGYLNTENVETCITYNCVRLDMFDTDEYDADAVLLAHENNIKIKYGSAYTNAEAVEAIGYYDVIECANISNPIFYILNN